MLSDLGPAAPTGQDARRPRHLRVVAGHDGRTALGIVGRAPEPVGVAAPVRDRRTGAPGWQGLARCTGLGTLFFPAAQERWDETQERERQALEVCDGCPVARECLAAGFASGDGTGVWGGTTPTQRVLLLIRDPDSALVAAPAKHPSL